MTEDRRPFPDDETADEIGRQLAEWLKNPVGTHFVSSPWVWLGGGYFCVEAKVVRP